VRWYRILLDEKEGIDAKSSIDVCMVAILMSDTLQDGAELQHGAKEDD